MRRVSLHRRAEKLEFIGEIVLSAADEECEIKELSGRRRSEGRESNGGDGCGGASSSSPQQPIVAFGVDEEFARVFLRRWCS